METSRLVLKRAIDKVGIKTVAKSLKLSPALLYRWCENQTNDSNSDSTTSINPMDRLRSIYEVTQDITLINWICKTAGGFFVKDPVPRKIKGDAEMFRQTQGVIKEFSDTLNAISQAYSDDNISPDEAERIRAEWEQLKRAGETLVCECELGDFNVKQKGKDRTNHRPVKRNV